MRAVIRRRAPRPGGPVVAWALVAALLAASFVAAPAGADVVVAASTRTEDAARATTWFGADGARRALAPVDVVYEDVGAIPAISPDGRTVARRTDGRVALLPVDGGPARILRSPGVEGYGTGGVWWDADGLHVQADAVSPLGAVLRCEVGTGACASVSVAADDLVAVTPSGSAVWTAGSIFGPLFTRVGPEDDLSDAEDVWVSVTGADIRRASRALARPVRTRLDLRRSDGRLVRRLDVQHRTLSRGVPEVRGVASSPAGTLIARERVRARLRLRTRKGGRQLRTRILRDDLELLRITEDGVAAVVPVRRSLEGDRVDVVEAAAGVPEGWAVRVTSKHGASLTALLTPDGMLRRVLVAGRPVTPRALHAALGRPADDAPSSYDAADLQIAGYEAATGALVVQYPDATGRSNVVRVPLDGTTPPRLVTRGAAFRELAIAVR